LATVGPIVPFVSSIRKGPKVFP